MLYISKERSKNTPEIRVDGSVVFPDKIQLLSWVNGEGTSSEHIKAYLYFGPKPTMEFNDEGIHVEIELQSLDIRSDERGLGCFVGGKRIALVQRLNYTAGNSVPPWPWLTLEISAV